MAGSERPVVCSALVSKSFSPKTANKESLQRYEEDYYTQRVLLSIERQRDTAVPVWLPLWKRDSEISSEVDVIAIVNRAFGLDPLAISESTATPLRSHYPILAYWLSNPAAAAAKKKEAEEAVVRRRADELAIARVNAAREASARKKAEEEAEALRREAEEEAAALQRAADEAAERKKALEEAAAAAKRKAEMDALAILRAEEAAIAAAKRKMKKEEEEANAFSFTKVVFGW